MKKRNNMAKYGNKLNFECEMYLIMTKSQYVTGWSTDEAFAKSCKGRNEIVVRVSS